VPSVSLFVNSCIQPTGFNAEMGLIVYFVVYSKIKRREVFATEEVCLHIRVRNNGIEVLLVMTLVIGIMFC
jgi:hypothetical protein